MYENSKEADIVRCMGIVEAEVVRCMGIVRRLK